MIRSPDFPDVEQRCEEFAEVRKVADEAIRAQLSKLEAEGRELPPPTPRESLATKGEYRECLLIPVDAED